MGKLDELIKKMNSKAKEEVVAYGLPEYQKDRIPFTSPRMNYCTFGGLPIGRLIEFYGEEHGGKTTTALDIVANYQQMDGAKKVLYVDVENRLDVLWATKLNVDLSADKFICFRPSGQSAEDIMQFIQDAVESDEVGLWIIDSIPAMSSQQELDKDMTEKTYAGVSGPLTVFSRKIEAIMHKHHCTGIGINQQREDMNAKYAGAMRTPGGKGWKYLCSVRMEFRKGKYIDENGVEMNNSAESPAGNFVLMSMTKNSTCPPTRRTGFYTINYEYGIDYLRDLVELAVKLNIIVQSGSWYNIVNVDTGEIVVKAQGMSKVYAYLEDEEHEDVLSMIEDTINKLTTIE